jgi:hypothetical protein
MQSAKLDIITVALITRINLKKKKNYFQKSVYIFLFLLLSLTSALPKSTHPKEFIIK